MSHWNAKYTNMHGEYEIVFASTNKEETKIIEKVCQAIIDKKITSFGDISFINTESAEPVQPAKIDYWANINALNNRQTEKGLKKYGEVLEDNTTLSRIQRIEHAEEEAIDLLKYLEHLKFVFTDELSANDYQRMAMRTAGDYNSTYDMLRNAAYGINGEGGEVIDLLKKYEFQGHALDELKILDELGDVVWYCALAAEALGTTLQEVMYCNIEKLKERYPDGFDKSRSINRKEYVAHGA